MASSAWAIRCAARRVPGHRLSHALLAHLHAVGFHGAPRPLGLDEQGREVLSFIPGTVAWPDHFDLLEPDRRLVHVAQLIRDFHDAVADFTPPPDARWQALIPAEGLDLIAHHDLAPWNLVVNDTQWAFIDWDVAAPGSRLWELAYALHGFVPLSADPRWQRHDAGHRLRVFVDAYGLDESQRGDLIPLLVRRTQAMHDFLAEQAVNGTQPWIRLWQAGHGDAWRADADYIQQHRLVEPGAAGIASIPRPRIRGLSQLSRPGGRPRCGRCGPA